MPTADQMWTPDEDATLLRLQEEGKSAREIARTIVKTRSAVIGRLYRLREKGLGLPKQSPRPRMTPRPETKPRRPSAPRAITALKAAEAEAVKANTGPGRHLGCPTSREPWRPIKGEAFKPLPGSEPIPLIGRPAFTCAWVVEGEGADALCCGQRASVGAYCPTHRKVAYLPTAPIRVRDFRRYAA
ncbi:MAG: hypothetical protein IM667_02490 [Phenylobacterium sp.]|uniref:GcrA family cell cycle regulator n=1 Tax=Phenylobacterium sp. TaxID=1871053 RepID=UPI0025D0B1A5|nr:GcrA family cell cycle regulator [Phenylobacterium sp.]MCA3712976.1 hypothetical protein [Phenylobacterium sp.]MCA6239484.1 hypothetical protein [Phenylobacterium sp.]